MWSPQVLLFTLYITLTCVAGTMALIQVSGYEGRSVEVPCPYQKHLKSNEKYLCRKACGYEDVLITTTKASKSRYSMHDDKDKQISTATISKLSFMDNGTYWCGVTVTGFDHYTKVNVHVEPDSCCHEVTKVQGYEGGSVTISCPYRPGDENKKKYICRGNRPSVCLQQALITSDSRQQSRFSLSDDKVSKIFTVTINHVTQNDSGLYLCGRHGSTGLDVFSGVELEVKEWCCVISQNVSGIVGHQVTMKCPYQRQRGAKFLCKGEHRNACVNVMLKRGSEQSDLRFTVRNDTASSSFLVTITDLVKDDAGTYWCGSEPRESVGKYAKIKLSLVFTQKFSTIKPVPSEPPHIHSNNIAVVLIAPVVVLIVVLIVTVAVVCKYKCGKKKKPQVYLNRTPKAAKAEVIYENEDVVKYSKPGTSKQPRSRCHVDDDACGDEQDSVYQNFSTEEIYLNQF